MIFWIAQLQYPVNEIGEIKDYVDNFGHDRILFGSDFPFGDPKEELCKIQDLSIAKEKKDMILGHNLKRLLKHSNI